MLINKNRGLMAALRLNERLARRHEHHASSPSRAPLSVDSDGSSVALSTERPLPSNEGLATLT